MINDSSASRNVLQSVLAANQGLPGELEQKARTAAIENKSKVNPAQHQKTMDYLAEQLGKLAQEQQTQQSTKEAKLPGQTGTPGQSQDKTMGETVVHSGLQSQQGQQGLAPNDPATKIASTLAGIAGQELASTEQLKKEAMKRNTEVSAKDKGQQTSSEPSNAQKPTTDAPSSPNVGNSSQTGGQGNTDSVGDGSVAGSQGNVDGTTPEEPTGKLPGWGPPNPPPPEFPPGFSMDSIAQASMQNHMSVLTELMTKMSNLMTEDALNKVEANRKHTELSNKANQAAIEKSEKEHMESLEKSQTAQKVGSCAMQALGGFLTAVMAISAIVTGGALSILAVGVGILFMSYDAIAAATGGTTISEAVIAPVMQGITELFQALTAAILEPLGVDSHTIELIGMVIGTLAAVAAMVGAMAAGAKFMNSGMASKLASMMGKSFAKIATKIVPGNVTRAFSQGARNFSSQFAKGMEKIRNALEPIMGKIAKNNPQKVYEAKLKETGSAKEAMTAKLQAVRENTDYVKGQLGTVQTVGMFSGVAVSAGSNISAAAYRYEGDMAHAFTTQLQQIMAVTALMMESVQEAFMDVSEVTQDLMRSALDAQSARTDSLNAIMQTMRKGV